MGTLFLQFAYFKKAWTARLKQFFPPGFSTSNTNLIDHIDHFTFIAFIIFWLFNYFWIHMLYYLCYIYPFLLHHCKQCWCRRSRPSSILIGRQERSDIDNLKRWEWSREKKKKGEHWGCFHAKGNDRSQRWTNLWCLQRQTGKETRW